MRVTGPSDIVYHSPFGDLLLLGMSIFISGREIEYSPSPKDEIHTGSILGVLTGYGFIK